MEISYWKEVRRTHTKIKKKFKLGDLVGKLNKLWYKCDADYKKIKSNDPLPLFYFWRCCKHPFAHPIYSNPHRF